MRSFSVVPAVALLGLLAACAGGGNADSASVASSDPAPKRVISDAEAGASQTERTMRMAERALAEGKPEVAAVFYRTAALAEPKNPKPRLASAALFEKSGEYAPAAGMFQQVALETKDTEHFLDAGRNYLKAGNATEAANVYKLVLEQEPKNVRALNGLAVSHDLRQEHKAAANLYEKAYDNADRDSRNGILVNWALSLMLAGEAGQAVQKLEPAVAESDLPSLRQTLAIAYGLSGRLDDAKELGLSNPPTYDELKATVREYGMAGPTSSAPQAVPVGDVVTVPAKKR